MHWLDVIRTRRPGLVLQILISTHQGCPAVWGSDSPVVKKENHNMSGEASVCSSHPSQPDWPGKRQSLSPSPLRGEGGDADSGPLTTPPAQRVVHAARVFTAHKCRSKLIHSGNTEKKALTDCLTCWHGYKLLDKKSNTLSLFSSPYNSQSCFQEKRGAASERPNATLQARTAHPGGDGLGCEVKVGPRLQGMRGAEPLTQPPWQQATGWLCLPAPPCSASLGASTSSGLTRHK